MSSQSDRELPAAPGTAVPAGPAPDPELAVLREQIDAVDRQLFELLNQRAQVVLKVGELKHRTGAPVYRPEREAQILGRLGASTGPLPGAALQSIWREVMSACRALERRLRVAYLGPRGTFSEMALLAHFGHGVEAVACPSIDEVFRSTEAGNTDFGVVPVENSTEGAVNRSLDLMLQTPLSILGETAVDVRHNLMTRSGTRQGITRVCAHPQALAQCAGWLDRNMPGVERVSVSSNAEGARLASLDDKVAGIAAETAAALYSLTIADAGIQDDPSNRTRFLIVGRYRCGPSGADQTSLILSVPDRAGAVHALIEPLARHGVSMKRFESRPARQGSWEYYFYIDLLGHQDDPPVAAALAEIRAHAAFFKVLGSYPRALGAAAQVPPRTRPVSGE
ncbi:MAG: prephenate dehydratase [Betaproteobacteria bacterium]|nr:prephenate dehydratase [Betaproteobacteria bacterium]